MNVAARVAEHAEAGHLLVSQDVVDAVGSTEVLLTPISSRLDVSDGLWIRGRGTDAHPTAYPTYG